MRPDVRLEQMLVPCASEVEYGMPWSSHLLGRKMLLIQLQGGAVVVQHCIDLPARDLPRGRREAVNDTAVLSVLQTAD